MYIQCVKWIFTKSTYINIMHCTCVGKKANIFTFDCQYISVLYIQTHRDVCFEFRGKL